MNFSLPDHIILERDAQKACKQLQSSIGVVQDIDGLPEPALSIARLNQSLVEEGGFEKLVNELKKVIDKTPVFDVIFATQPHDSFLQEVSNWFRREIHPNTLLKVLVRRSIAGGIVVRSKNRIFDMSLRPRVVEGREKLPEVLNHV